jgi:hypothetical protein
MLVKEVSSERAEHIGTCGACGVVARIILHHRPDAVPYVDDKESPSHVAAYVPGHGLIHFGEDTEDEMQQVTRDEFYQIIKEFDPKCVRMRHGEMLAMMKPILTKIRIE